jgi:hypothetical protein
VSKCASVLVLLGSPLFFTSQNCLRVSLGLEGEARAAKLLDVEAWA